MADPVQRGQNPGQIGRCGRGCDADPAQGQIGARAIDIGARYKGAFDRGNAAAAADRPRRKGWWQKIVE